MYIANSVTHAGLPHPSTAVLVVVAFDNGSSNREKKSHMWSFAFMSFDPGAGYSVHKLPGQQWGVPSNKHSSTSDPSLHPVQVRQYATPFLKVWVGPMVQPFLLTAQSYTVSSTDFSCTIPWSCSPPLYGICVCGGGSKDGDDNDAINNTPWAASPSVYDPCMYNAPL